MKVGGHVIVDPESGKGGKVHRDQRSGEVGGGEQGMHGGEVSGEVSPTGKGGAGGLAGVWGLLHLSPYLNNVTLKVRLANSSP